MRAEQRTNDLPRKTCLRPLGPSHSIASASLWLCPQPYQFVLLISVSQLPLLFGSAGMPGALGVRGQLSPAASVTSKSQGLLCWLVLLIHRITEWVRVEGTIVGHMVQPHYSRGRVILEHMALYNLCCLYLREGRTTICVFYLPMREMAFPESAVAFLWCPQSFLPPFPSYLLLQAHLPPGLHRGKGLQAGSEKS